MEDWNPNLYLRFEKERTQPVKDLISRVKKDDVRRVVDIGCGPGNSTRELKNKWPQADIIGLDSSANMIKKAKEDMPELQWIIADAGGDLSYLGKFDIVFSNAVIQWIPGQEGLLGRLFSILGEGGVLAVQVPNTSNMPIQWAIDEIAGIGKWDSILKGYKQEFFYEEPEFYYDILCRLTKELYIWETRYFHVMDGHRQIIEWIKSTGMKPYLDKLPDERLREEFQEDVLKLLEKEYQVQKDGKVLFPFRRIFFTAYNVK
ncbi:MAG: methyltransferase domain-containing protein [Bacillota bacterium]|nr:methyltransferase domain-containing protein [Bacillota bacterium]